MSLVHNERVKLTAGYLNAAASAAFAAGVVAPLAAIAFGIPTAQGQPTLTFAVAVLTFFALSVSLHLAARYLLKGLRP